MDLRQMECFIAVAHQLHFRRAAEELHMSQATLSAVIRSLEVELGKTLFDRSTRSVTLTEWGQDFLPEAEDALSHVRRTFENAREVAASGRRRIVVGCNMQTADQHECWAEVERRCQGIEVESRFLSSDEQLALLKRGELDAAQVTGGVDDPALESLVTGQDPHMAIVHPDHHLADEPAVSLAQVAVEPTAMFDRGQNRVTYDLIVDALRAATPGALDVWAAKSPLAQFDAVAEAGRVGILPGSDYYVRSIPLYRCQPGDRSLAMVPITDAPLAVRTLVWRKGESSPELETLIDVLTG